MKPHCKNCGKPLIGKYCIECGQKASVGDLTLHELWHEAWHSVTHTDKGILKLIKDLAVQPRQVYLRYFEGQRKKYFSPVTFFLVTAALLIIIGVKVFDYQDYVYKTNNEFGRFLFEETKFRSLLLLPIQVLLTRLIFFKQYNLAKNIVFWLFLNGFVFTVKILLSPLYFLFISHKEGLDNVNDVVGYIIMLVHLIMVFGKGKPLNWIGAFVIINLLYLTDYGLSVYLLFGDQMFIRTHAKNVFDLVRNAYRW